MPNINFFYAPGNLERRPITLEKHIWLIFQFETSINHSDRYLQFENSTKDVRHWMEALKTYVLKGSIDRQRFLKESILASNRNFNKSLSGWFIDLFEFLQPEPGEILALQPELLSTLNSPHSKAVNAALNGIKEIVDATEFNVHRLLDATPILLSGDSKSVVTKSLALLEKILRKKSELKEQICISVCQAFIQKDEEIQSRTAKLLLKYGSDQFPSVANELERYADSMLMSSKKLLAEFLSPLQQDETGAIPAGDYNVEPASQVEEVASVDELIFLSSQAFDNNDPLHIDLLPAALVKWQDKINGPILPKFEAALQRAYSFVMNDWPSTMGYLDHLLATFFIDLTKLWIARFPINGASLQQVHDSFRKRDEENKAKWKWYQSRILGLSTWSVVSKDTTYIIHKAVLLVAYEKIQNGQVIPLLSTPSYHNGCVDPVALVKRLEIYQARDIKPDDYDFQLALSRVANIDRDEGLQAARKTLKGEILQIIEFLLNPETRPVGPFTTPSLWFMAGIVKSSQEIYPEFKDLFYSTLPRSIFTGNVPWQSFTEHFKTSRYNFEKKKSEEVPAQHNVMRLTLNPQPVIWQEPEEAKGLLSKLKQLVATPKKDKRADAYILYEYISLKAQFLSAEHNDIQRFCYLFPGNPNPLLTMVAARALTHSTFSSESEKKIVTKVLDTLNNLTFEFTEMSHLFLATCLLTSDKTVRSFAAELWINGVGRNKIDSSRIGEIIGTHMSSGYAPMKRFTEIISDNLLKISPLHNKALELLLTATIERIRGDAPTGTKRLLEIYSELLLINNSSITSLMVKENLNFWSSSPSLKKIVGSMI